MKKNKVQRRLSLWNHSEETAEDSMRRVAFKLAHRIFLIFGPAPSLFVVVKNLCAVFVYRKYVNMRYCWRGI